MQFTKRSNCPDLLTEKQAQWTVPWVAHYRWKAGISAEAERPKRPSTSHWLKDEIRLLLIKDFHNNCGYCGEVLPTPQQIEKQKTKPVAKGDIDHFLPKAKYPELVYEWENYVWSCKPCNQSKKEFYDVAHPLLNPCLKEDCRQLVFIEDTGQYGLRNSVVDDEGWQQRFKNSEQKTMLNAVDTCQKRRLRISTLRQRFASVAANLNMIQQLKTIQPNADKILFTDHLKGQIKNSITEIEEIRIGSDFYSLLQEKYQMLGQEYPQVAALFISA